jgi:hypothetical protein
VIESLLLAGLTGLVVGALMLGTMRGEQKASRGVNRALHARVDGLILALAQHGLIDAGAVAHLARASKSDIAGKAERRRD